jgi:hypothetical protein
MKPSVAIRTDLMLLPTLFLYPVEVLGGLIFRRWVTQLA